MARENLKTIMSHDIPSIFYKYPGLIKVGYGISYLNQLRKWHVKAQLNKLVKQYPGGSFSMTDAGCGEGQYMFPLAARCPDATITGIDKLSGNINFANTYIAKRPFRNVHMVHSFIEECPPLQPADIVMCIGVLHFAENDAVAMRKLADMTASGGHLLFEVPVNGKMVSPLYKWAQQRYGGYDLLNGRKRDYRPADVEALVSGAGLQITSVTYAYGTAGRLGHEIYNAPLVMMLGGNRLEQLIGGIVINLLYPLVLLLFTIDYCFRHKDGNCMIVVAAKA